MLSSPRESTKFLYRHAKNTGRRQEVARFFRRLPHESKVVEPINSGSEHGFTGTQRHKILPSAQWGATKAGALVPTLKAVMEGVGHGSKGVVQP